MNMTTVRHDHTITFFHERITEQPVCVAGTFNDWQQQEMQQTETGLWFFQTPSLGAGRVEYKFIVEGNWINDPFNVRLDDESGNSLIYIDNKHGNIYRHSFFSPAFGYNKSYALYLPPTYVFDNERLYPTLFLMGGLFDYELSWIKDGNIVDTLDTILGDGQIEDLIVIMPDKDNNCFAEGDWSQYKAYLNRDLLQHCQTEYRCDMSQRKRAIEGLSLGAGWALRLAAEYPDLYGSVSSLSGFIPEDVITLLERNREDLIKNDVRFRLFCGDQETDLIPHLHWAQEWFTSLGLSCEFYQGKGIHRWPLWQENIKNSLLFHDFGFQQQ